MSTLEGVGALVGAIIMVVVLWKAIRGGLPRAEDKDMRGTFHSD